MTLAEIALPFAERGEAETIALADDIYRRIVGGASFAAMAREYSRSATAPSGRRARADPGSPAAAGLPHPGAAAQPGPGHPAGADLRRRRASSSSCRSTRSAREPTAADDDPEAREALRQQLFTERITSFGQGYLQELLGDALIVER